VRELLEAGAQLPPATSIDVAEIPLSSFDELLGGGSEVVQ
jgi:hypothetical protein